MNEIFLSFWAEIEAGFQSSDWLVLGWGLYLLFEKKYCNDNLLNCGIPFSFL